MRNVRASFGFRIIATVAEDDQDRGHSWYELCLVWRGAGFMIAWRLMIGWISWLIVATVLYALAWTRLDPTFGFALPSAIYLWLEEGLGVSTAEGSYDLSIWSTSLLAVVGLHAVVWLIVLRRKRTEDSRSVQVQRFRILLGGIGWLSWLLVSTGVVVLIGEAIYTARGGELLPHSVEQDVELFLVFLVMCLLHLAVWRFWHRQQR
jgi:hypothetical protein